MSKPKTDDYTNFDDVIGVLIPDGKPPELIRQPKRGKDIKAFADLPPDMQQTIDSLSDSEQEHKLRTSIAIGYQHMTCNVTEEGIKYGQA